MLIKRFVCVYAQEFIKNEKISPIYTILNLNEQPEWFSSFSFYFQVREVRARELNTFLNLLLKGHTKKLNFSNSRGMGSFSNVT